MRRLAIFTVILALSAALIAVTCGALFESQREVEVTERVYFGNQSCAEGLDVVYQSYIPGTCSWDTCFTLGGGEPVPRSVFKLGVKGSTRTGDGRFELTRWREEFAVRGAYLDTWYPRVIDAPANDVADRTGPGETRREVVRPADYYEYWPLDASWRYGGLTRRGAEQLGQLFRLRVPGELMVEITVRRDAKGNIESIESRRTDTWHEPVTEEYEPDSGTFSAFRDEDEPDISACTAVTGEGIWIYPTALDGDGNNVMEYRDGPGVYFIPMATSEIWNSLSVSEQLNADPGKPLIERAVLLYPTDERPVLMRLDVEGSAVSLYTLVDGTLWLARFDAHTGEAMGRVPVMPMEGGSLRLGIEKEGLTLLADFSGNISILEERGNGAEPVFYTGLDAETAIEGYGKLNDFLLFPADAVDFAFDGERAALANGETGFILTADQDGATYLARFDLSTMRDGSTGPDDHYSGTAFAGYDGKPMKIRFNK